ncbi:MAG: hypothetical protein FJY74_06250 [Candidatus Eisenbacteria bacterium]|nr:hypothetical protein [Candidatus Eisenbacteria bacterium]
MTDHSRHSNMRRTVTRASLRRKPRRKLEVGGDVQTSYFFMLNCLLHSRVHTGLESNSRVHDEDVNVYLAHLLNAHIDSQYIERVGRYVAADDASLHRMIESSPDLRGRYMVYRSTADFLLMSVAVFDLFERRRYNRCSAFHTPKEAYIGRAAAYYAVASSLAAKLEGGACAVAATLRKLSDGIDGYVRILSYMRGQYLGFIHRYSSGELFHLDRTIEEIRRDEALESLRDEFLDTYHTWLKTRQPEIAARLREQADRLREIDPAFEFTPPA